MMRSESRERSRLLDCGRRSNHQSGWRHATSTQRTRCDADAATVAHPSPGGHSFVVCKRGSSFFFLNLFPSFIHWVFFLDAFIGEGWLLGPKRFPYSFEVLLDSHYVLALLPMSLAQVPRRFRNSISYETIGLGPLGVGNGKGPLSEAVTRRRWGKNRTSRGDF